MKIIIPTLTKQIEKQITFADLNKIKEHIWFVTDKETAKHLCVLHNQIIILDKKDITYNDLLKYIIITIRLLLLHVLILQVLSLKERFYAQQLKLYLIFKDII